MSRLIAIFSSLIGSIGGELTASVIPSNAIRDPFNDEPITDPLNAEYITEP